MKKSLLVYPLIFVVVLFSQFSNSQTCDVPNNIYQNTSDTEFESTSYDYGQSITADCNGHIQSIRVFTTEVTSPVTGTLNIYAGTPPFTGVNTVAPVYQQAISWPTSSSETAHTIELTPSFAVVSGTKYTFIVTGTVGKVTYQVDQSNISTGNTYPDGFFMYRNPSTSYWQRDGGRDQKFQIHYTDVIAPPAQCKNATIYLDANGEATLSPLDIDNNTPGGVVSRSVSKSNFDCTNLGTNTVTLTVNDSSLNTDFCDATVTVVDNLSPINTSCPQNIVVSNCGLAPVTYDIPTFTDNCEVVSVERIAGPESGSVFPINQTTTVTHRATDSSGLTTDCTFTVTPQDLVFTTVTGIPVDQTINLTDTCEGFIAAYTPMVTDNCPGVVTDQTTGISGTGPFPVGTTVNTLTFTDLGGNVTTESFNVTVIDDTIPTITGVPNDQTINLTDTCDGYISPYTLVLNDNCIGAINQTTGVSGTGPFPVGATTNTFTFTDGGGNMVTESFTVTVIDVAPNAACQDVTVELDVYGLATVSVADINNGSSDNCSIVSLSLSAMNFNGATSNTGPTDELLGNGQTYYINSYSFTPPVTANYEFVFNGTSSDNQGIVMVLWDDVPVRNSGNFQTDRDEYAGFTVRNTGGLFTFGDQSFNLIGGETYYFDITTNTPANTVTYQGDVLINNTELNFNCSTGVYPIELIVEDNAGLTSRCNSTITVNTPAITLAFESCQSNHTFYNDVDVCTNNITFSIPTLVNTSCGATVTQVEGLSSGSDFPIGDTLMKFTATNDFRETAVCEFTFTVVDNQPPTPTSPDNIVVDNSPTGTGIIVNYTTTFLDNCTDVANLSVTYPSGLASGSEFPVGTTYNKIEAADESGNTSFCSLFVTVNDTFDPVIACQDYTADLNNSATVDVFPIDLDNGSTDNSGNLNFGFLGNSFSGVIDTNSPTDIFEGGGLDTHYVAVYAFQVPQDGQYDFSVSGVTSSSNNDRFLLSLHDQRPLLMTGEGLFDGPGYISNSFRLFNGDGSPNDGPAEFNLIANKTYFVEISSEAFNATANFRFSVNQNIITTEAFLSFDCTDVGTDNQTTLYAFDDGGNIVTCTQTVSVINSTVANAVCQDIDLTQAELDANNGKVYPQDIDNGSTGFKAFSTSYIEETMTTATPIIENVNGDEYYHKKMTFIPESSGTTTVTINTNKPLIFVIYDEEQTTINFSQSLTGMPVQSGSTTGLLGALEEGKVYYGYFVIFTGTDFTTDAEFSMSYDNSSIKSTLAFIEPVDCPTQQELFVFNSCGAIDSCTANITINNCNDTHFITTWNLSDPSDLSITIPTATGETYNYEVDWNHDPANGFNSGGTYTGDATSPSNQYAATGEYKVAIRGDFPRIFFGGGSGENKIIDINQWGENSWTSMFGAFTGCENIDITAQDTPDLSNADNMQFMFAYCTNFDGSTANWNWDVSTITNMSRVFESTSFVGNVSISFWNTRNVLRMVHMFRKTSFNINIGNWDLSSMLQFQMDGMFEDVTLSTAVYDAILFGWATDSTVPGDGIDDIPVNTGFHGGNSRYCAAEDAWNTLNTDNSWNIIDDGGCSDSDLFITTWSVEENGTITIPTTGTGYDYVIDWNYNGTSFNGDGITYTDGDTATSPSYSAGGTYEIAIFGNFPRIYFNNQGDNDKITEIKQWGTGAWSSMENAFKGCYNLQLTATDSPDLSLVSSTNSMFYGCQTLTGHDSMNDWEMSTIFSMREMFTIATNFNANISSWDVSNVSDMFGLFLVASTFDQDISGWNVGNVTNMDNMFSSAGSFNKNIGGWNVAKVETMENMFYSATAFNQEIGGWNVGLVDNMRSMFYNASGFDGDISSWNVENVLVMDTMFRNATSFNQDLGGWDVSSVTNMYEMFAGATAFDQNIGAWDISSLNTANGTLGANGMFSGVELSVDNYDALLIGWATDTSPGDSVDDIPTGITFSGGNSFYCEGAAARALLIADYGWTIATDDTYLPAYCGPEEDKFKTTWVLDSSDKSVRIPTTGTGYNYIVNWGDGTTTINHNGDASHTYENAGTYQISISGDFPRIFFEDALSNNDKKIISIDQWGAQVWSSMESAFSYCTNLEMNATDMPNLSQVESMAEMFRECSAALFNPSIGSWDVSNVTSMRRLFIDAYLFDQDINAWNVGNVTNMSYMFNNAQLFNKPLNNWDVSSVTNMEGMFFNAEIFDQDLGDWDISMLSNALRMFEEIALSIENYDALLIGWSTLDTSEGETQIPTGVNFNGGNSIYCDGASARGILSDPPYNWGISDGGECGFFATTWQTTEANESITIYTSSTDLPSLPDVLEGPFVYDYNIDWGDGQVDLNVTGNISHTYLTAGDHKVRIEGVFPHMSAGNGGDDISNASKLKSIDVWGDLEWKSMAYSFTYCSNMVLNASDSPDVSQVTNMSAAFAVCYEITDPDLSGWDVSNVENMKYTFLEAVLFTGDITQWDVSSVTDMSYMFSDALQFNGDINGWNVSNVITMEGMFSDANTFNRDLNDWDITSVKNMEFMFNGETHFNGNISSWDVSGVTSMFGMFSGNEGFNQNIGSWDVRSVDNISYMFDGATAFNQNLATWDLGNVLTAENMFTVSGISLANYDDTLIGWATDSSSLTDDGIDDIPSNVTLDATVAYCLSASERQNLISTYGWTINDGGLDPNCNIIQVSPKVYLQGAALNPNVGEESLMRDDLRVAGYIPTKSPYADMISCETTVFNLGGTLGSGVITNDIVDWVWVELRDKDDNTLVVASQSALLQRDGDVVAIDGTSALSFYAIADGSYYVAIKHRNHLGIMSNTAIVLNTTTTVIDFTNGSVPTYGTNAQTSLGMPIGISAMWAGDANNDGLLNYLGAFSDVPFVRSQVFNDPNNSVFGGPPVASYSSQGYHNTDVNMNGVTVYSGGSSDVLSIRNNIFNNSLNSVFGGPPVATYTFMQQLPEGAN